MLELPPSIRSLAHLFESCCRRKPEDLAYAFVLDTLELDSRLTYCQLESRVRLDTELVQKDRRENAGPIGTRSTGALPGPAVNARSAAAWWLASALVHANRVCAPGGAIRGPLPVARY